MRNKKFIARLTLVKLPMLYGGFKLR